MMANVSTQPDNDSIINVGSNYRIEAGPKLVTAIATEELLSNDRTASHYAAPVIDPVTGQKTFTKDSMGNAIILGKDMTYLEWGTDSTLRQEVYYIYEKISVDNTNEFTNDGEPNPYFVAPHIHEEKADSADRLAYDYVWKEVATRASEEAAIEFAQRKAVD